MIELVPQLRTNDRIDSGLNIYMTTRGYSLGLSLKIHLMSLREVSLLTVPLAIVRRIPHGVSSSVLISLLSARPSGHPPI